MKKIKLFLIGVIMTAMSAGIFADSEEKITILPVKNLKYK